MATKNAITQKSNGNTLKATISNSNQHATSLTPEEKKILKHRLSTRPGESKVLLAQLSLVSNNSVLWFRDFHDENKLEAVKLETYLFRDNIWEGDKDYLNHEAFYVLCRFDGRLWRCKNFKEIALLRRALKKDLVTRYTDFKWEL